jgi:3-methyl-2-oxobutanoate hydroxymethyltransferase
MYGPKGQGSSGRLAGQPKKVTVPEIRARKGGLPLAMVTAYDFTMARLLDAGGVDMILVGDSLGMVIQGHPTTLPVTVEDICYHGRAVSRGARRAHVVGDMPFMSFQVSPIQALENAGRMMKDGAFESIKLEGGEEVAEHVRRIVAAGIPVMGHVGLTPQSVHAMGGFKVQGKGEHNAARVIRDAKALEEATIGIGAGAGCDGQVLVCYDLLGMFPDLEPKFAKRFAQIGEQIVQATQLYVGEVQERTFPGPEHTFKPNDPRRAPRPVQPSPEPTGLTMEEIPPHWQTH